jgi:hypothetical protein
MTSHDDPRTSPIRRSAPSVGGVPVGADHSVFSLTASPGLPDWLAEHDVSLLLTTYQAGRLFAVG